MVAQCLVELSSAKSTFRFTIEGDDGKIYILVSFYVLKKFNLWIPAPKIIIYADYDSVCKKK